MIWDNTTVYEHIYFRDIFFFSCNDDNQQDASTTLRQEKKIEKIKSNILFFTLIRPGGANDVYSSHWRVFNSFKFSFCVYVIGIKCVKNTKKPYESQIMKVKENFHHISSADLKHSFKVFIFNNQRFTSAVFKCIISKQKCVFLNNQIWMMSYSLGKS